MKLLIKDSFQKELKKYKSGKLLKQVGEILEKIKLCKHIWDVGDVKLMQGTKDFFRIRVGNFRIGIKIQDETVFVIKFAIRGNFYKNFP
ncbi:MAG: hypothetical protein SFU25_03760 [Candidatus Caenarcaniphilales bacterium]|nr:hypothetical protein [Candidatus Caenarcaniphilales bacterium]